MVNSKIARNSLSCSEQSENGKVLRSRASSWMLPALAGILAAVSLFSLGCSKKGEEEAEAATVTVQAAAAQQAYIAQQVTADAVLFPIDQAAIVPKITAPVKKYYVQRGSHVKAG